MTAPNLPRVILRDPRRAPMLAAAREAVRIGNELMAAYLAADHLPPTYFLHKTSGRPLS